MQINKEINNKERVNKNQENTKNNKIKPKYVIPLEEIKKVNYTYLNEKEKITESAKNQIYKNFFFSKNEPVVEEYISIQYEKDKKENIGIKFENLKQNKKLNFHININKIINTIKSPEIQKYIIINSTIINTNKSEDNKNDQKENSYSLDDSSLRKIDSSNTANNTEEKRFNSIRANFYLKNNLYDIPLNTMQESIPDKYIINEEKFGFLYPNDIISYCITKTGLLSNASIKANNEYNNDNQFDRSLGLYFCGNEIAIQTEKGKIYKKCAPNQFICKLCMNKSKARYEIKKNYLININGRVAKKNKGSYHCFGHFLCGNQIEDCINKFSCKACKLIDLNSHYYL